jgi:hypothetical protein
MIAAAPGFQRNPGPHGISLMAHARAGGAAASQTVAYLESLGDADARPRAEPLIAEQLRAYTGRFQSAALPEEMVEIRVNNSGELAIAVKGRVVRLQYVGDHAFCPAGAPAVRVQFTQNGAGVDELAIVDHVRLLTASRVS